jgi:hypothetical protein
MNKGTDIYSEEIPFDEQALIDFIEANRKEGIGYDLGDLQLRVYELDGDKIILSYEYYGHLSTPTYFRVRIIDQKIFVSESSDYPDEVGSITCRPFVKTDVQSVLIKFFPLPDIKEPCE